jgi:hypothetical protein
MTSQEAKRLIVQEAFPIDSRFRAAVTESLQNADVLMVRHPHDILEFEVKVSRGDFMCEIKNIRFALGIDTVDTYRAKGGKGYRSLSYDKYTKHANYLGIHDNGSTILHDSEGAFVPHRFYFAVPTEMVDFAISKVVEYKLPYGVVELCPGIPVLRPAKRLATAHITATQALYMFYRCFREGPINRFQTQTSLPLDEAA